MKAKYELKNFIDSYGLQDTLDALSDLIIEQYKASAWLIVVLFIRDMMSEFNIEEQGG